MALHSINISVFMNTVLIIFFYQKDSLLDFPKRIYLQKSSIFTESFSRGIEEVTISYDGKFEATSMARVNSPNPGTMAFTSLTILNGGYFHHAVSTPSQLNLNLQKSFTITAGGIMNVSVLHLDVSNVYIDGEALLTARERGFPCGMGKEPGRNSATSASGAGHGGAGGRGSDQPVVGKAYGSFDKPIDPGSGGGRGSKNLVCFEKMIGNIYIYVSSTW